MPKQNMTERWLEHIAAKAPKQRQEWTDTGQRLPGVVLLLRNGPERMTWALRYRSPADGSRRRLKIGFYPLMNLEEARVVHRDQAEQLRKEVDPLLIIRERENLPTLAEVIVDFIEHCRSPLPGVEGRTRVKGWKAYAHRLGVKFSSGLVVEGGIYMPKEWLHLSIATIDSKMIRRNAARILEEHGDASANTWQRTFSSMLSHAVRKSWLEHHPARGIPLLGKESPNEKVFDWQQIQALWRAAEQTDSPGARVVQWMLLTGQRAQTVFPMTWDQIQGDWWRIPVNQLKTRRGDHLVYIGAPQLQELLGRWREKTQSEYVFANMRGKPYQETSALAHLAKSLRKKSGVDDFMFKRCRPTVATRMTELGVELQHVALALDHAIPGVPPITRKHYVNSAEFRGKIRGAFEPYHRALTRHHAS